MNEIHYLVNGYNCDTVNNLWWGRIPSIRDSIKEKVLHFIRSKTLTNDLDACEIGSYIVINVDIVKAADSTTQ